MLVFFARFKASFIFILFSVWLGAVPAAADDADGIAVHVRKDGGVVFVTTAMLVPVAPRQAWDVLIDYEKMPQFMPNLDTSKIIDRHDNRVRLAQAGTVAIGPFSLAYDYVREVELTPYRAILSTVVAGSSLKSGRVMTRLLAEGEATRIIYDSEAVPNIWIPLGISEAFIRGHVRDQMESMRTEMLRRKQAAK